MVLKTILKTFRDNAHNMHILPDWKGPFNLAHTYISLGYRQDHICDQNHNDKSAMRVD